MEGTKKEYCNIVGRKRTQDKIQEVYNTGENFVLDAERRKCTAYYYM